MESDQRLQLPPAGSGGHSHPGAGLRPGHGHRRSRRRARLGQDRPVRAPGRRRPHLLLRERRHPLRRGDLQGAGLHPPVGPHLRRALRGRGSDAAPVPLRGPGQLARSDRSAAREQRAPHRARGPRGDAVTRRPGPGPAVAGLERGPRPAPAVGPAVVTAHPTDPGPRNRPPRVRRHLRGIDGHRSQDVGVGRRRHDRVDRRAGPRRGLRGGRRIETSSGRQPIRPRAPHRDGRTAGGRRELLHRDRALTAGPGSRRCRLRPAGRSGRGGRAARPT